jgi:hypothetical protein
MLEKKASGGAAAMNGGSSGGYPTLGSGGASASVSGGAATTGGSPSRPSGPGVLTLLHGVVDAEQSLVCFLVDQGKGFAPIGQPAPEGGLGYGESLVIQELDGVDFTSDAVEPVLITGELELVQGLDCADAIELAAREQAAGEAASEGGAGGEAGAAGAGGAGGTHAVTSESGGAAGADPPSDARAFDFAGAGGEGGAAPYVPPPRLRVGRLPSVPPGTVVGDSFLLVAEGCIGGRAFGGKHATDACGDAYSTRAPTLSASFVTLSRETSESALGVQFVHAAMAVGRVELDAAAPGSTPITIASAVRFGAIAPREGSVNYDVALYRMDTVGASVSARDASGPSYDESWASILGRASVTPLQNGENVALVLVGPALDLTASGFWNPPAIALVRSNPGQ